MTRYLLGAASALPSARPDVCRVTGDDFRRLLAIPEARRPGVYVIETVAPEVDGSRFYVGATASDAAARVRAHLVSTAHLVRSVTVYTSPAWDAETVAVLERTTWQYLTFCGAPLANARAPAGGVVSYEIYCRHRVVAGAITRDLIDAGVITTQRTPRDLAAGPGFSGRGLEAVVGTDRAHIETRDAVGQAWEHEGVVHIQPGAVLAPTDATLSRVTLMRRHEARFCGRVALRSGRLEVIHPIACASWSEAARLVAGRRGAQIAYWRRADGRPVERLIARRPVDGSGPRSPKKPGGFSHG